MHLAKDLADFLVRVIGEGIEIAAEGAREYGWICRVHNIRIDFE